MVASKEKKDKQLDYKSHFFDSSEKGTGSGQSESEPLYYTALFTAQSTLPDQICDILAEQRSEVCTTAMALFMFFRQRNLGSRACKM